MDDRLPPFAEKAEQAALGCLLIDPEKSWKKFDRFGVIADWFYDGRHQEIFRISCDLRAEGLPASTVLVGDRLQASGKATPEKLVYMSALADAPETSIELDSYLATLKSYHIRRRYLRECHWIQQDALNPKAKIEDVISRAGALSKIAGDTGGLLEIDARLFNPSLNPGEIRPVFSIGNAPFATAGNLTNIISQVKSGKSAFIGAIIASTMALDGADTLGVTSSNPDGKAVLHFDTEQSIEDHWHGVNRILRRSGLSTAPGWFRSYCFTGLDALKARSAVLQAIERAADDFSGIHSIHLDGYADLVRDVNDPGECNEFVAQFHAHGITNGCPILGVIHQNPGAEKTRGHLGSQLERKAESNLRLEKDGDTIEIWSEKQRRAPILRGTGPRFQWSDAAGMHLSCEFKASARDSEKAEKLEILRDEVFGERLAMRYSEIIFTLKNDMRVAEKTAERKVTEFRKFGLIAKGAANLWTKNDLQ